MTDSIILYQLKAKSLLYLVFIAKFAIREYEAVLPIVIKHLLHIRCYSFFNCIFAHN